jgi:cell division protein FtsN
LFVFIALVLVVIASFWITFQLAKKILSPANRLSEPKIKVAIPEPPPSIKSLQKLGISISGETIVPAKKTKKQAKAKVLCPTQKKIREMKKTRIAGPSTSPSGRYYKLQAGLYPDLTAAKTKAEQLRAGGIEVFVRKTPSGYRVQAGAYKTQAMAEKAKKAIGTKGFQSQIIYE